MSRQLDSVSNAAEVLNKDNTILNSVNLDEFDIIRKPPVRPRPKFSGLTLKKNAIAKSSSGFSSMSSLENFELDSEEGPSKDKSVPLKRLSDSAIQCILEKKIKTDNEPISKNISKLKINESGIGILQDTLDSIDVSKLLEKNGINYRRQSPVGKPEFDAFADYLNKNYSPVHGVNRQLFDNTDISSNIDHTKPCKVNDGKSNLTEIFNSQPIGQIENNTQSFLKNSNKDQFTQSFNTQVIDHLDTAVNLHENSFDGYAAESNKENISNKRTSQINEGDTFKVPLLNSFRQKLEAKTDTNESILDKEIGERSTLFEDENITNQYRHQVDNLFEQIEHSIYAMGTDEPSKTVPDQILDIIFSDEVSKPKSDNPDKNDHIEWPENTLLNGVSFDASFGTVIKKALINNATKSVQPQKTSNTLNLSLVENKVRFTSLGPFYGLPSKVKELIRQYKGIEELYGWQDECLKLPAIENRKNLIYALPTSGGKTLVAEILMLRELMCYKRNAIFILPYVSIVQEKVWTFSPFGVALDFLVEEYASSKGTYPPRKRRRKNSVYIATIEKALGIINSLIETGRLQEIGLIVVDELHLIGEDGRGATLEATLTKIMFLKANIQIVGMSATIGNLPDICKFLNADVYTQNFRPVELTEFVKCGKEIAKINWTYSKEDDLLVDPKRVDYKYSDSLVKLDPDMLGGLVMDVIPKGSCLIFCASKKNCENVANLLCKLCKPELKNYKKAEKEQIIHALKDEAGDLCDILRVSVQYGIAYHHSGLTSDERRIVEEGFRAGIIYVICCTSTLAAGVNLPARRVILRSPYIGRDFINLSRYKQMVGRAGRAGLGEAGDSILIAQPQDLPKVRKLLMSPMNQALSGMHIMDGKGLRHLLLSCISLGIANTRVQLQAVTSQTLLAVQNDRLEVNIKRLTDKVIKNLFKLGALKESCGLQKNNAPTSLCDVSVKMDISNASIDTQETPVCDKKSAGSSKKPRRTVVLANDTKLVVSELGSAAIKGGLELSRAHLLYEDLYQAQSSLVLQGHLHLLYLVTPYETAEQINPNKQIYYDVFTHLQPNELKVAKTLGLNESVAVKLLSNIPVKSIPERVINRFYVTLMLYDLWNEMPVFQVSEKYQISRGIVQNLMMISATFASNVVNFCEELQEFWAYSYLLRGMSQRLAHCCVKELAPLMELPAVKQSRAKQLYNAGYKTLQAVAKANANDLVDNIEFMSRRVANQLIAAAKMLLLERVENLREEAEDVLDGVENPKQILNRSILQ